MAATTAPPSSVPSIAASLPPTVASTVERKEAGSNAHVAAQPSTKPARLMPVRPPPPVPASRVANPPDADPDRGTRSTAIADTVARSAAIADAVREIAPVVPRVDVVSTARPPVPPARPTRLGLAVAPSTAAPIATSSAGATSAAVAGSRNGEDNASPTSEGRVREAAMPSTATSATFIVPPWRVKAPTTVMVTQVGGGAIPATLAAPVRPADDVRGSGPKGSPLSRLRTATVDGAKPPMQPSSHAILDAVSRLKGSDEPRIPAVLPKPVARPLLPPRPGQDGVKMQPGDEWRKGVASSLAAAAPLDGLFRRRAATESDAVGRGAGGGGDEQCRDGQEQAEGAGDSTHAGA